MLLVIVNVIDLFPAVLPVGEIVLVTDPLIVLFVEDFCFSTVPAVILLSPTNSISMLNTGTVLGLYPDMAIVFVFKPVSDAPFNTAVSPFDVDL